MTQDTFELPANKRTLLGKKTKSLRRQGIIPANIFGEVKESVAISVDAKELQGLLKHVSDTSIIYLQVEGEKDARPTLVDSMDTNPVSGQVLHVSFRQVNLKEAVTAAVPIELVGELDIVGATVVQVRDELEVEALPTDLPESFEIDLSKFTEIGQEVTVKDLHFDSSKVSVEAEEDTVLLQIQEEEQMAEVVEETPEVAEVETTEQKAEGEEGEKPAEGGEAKPENKEEKEE